MTSSYVIESAAILQLVSTSMIQFSFALRLFRPDFFLLVDSREFFFRPRVEGTKKKNKKNPENDQLTGHFQSFFLFFQRLFFQSFFFL